MRRNFVAQGRRDLQQEAQRPALAAVHADALRIACRCYSLGLRPLLEDSVFFAPPASLIRARALATAVLNGTGSPSPGVTWEVLPGDGEPGAAGPLVKIPLGRHPLSGRRTLFLSDDGLPDSDQWEALRSVTPLNGDQIVRALSAADVRAAPEEYGLQAPPLPSSAELPGLEEPAVLAVVSGCTMERRLIGKGSPPARWRANGLSTRAWVCSAHSGCAALHSWNRRACASAPPFPTTRPIASMLRAIENCCKRNEAHPIATLTYDQGRLSGARELVEQVVASQSFVQFLTLPAYEGLH